jgi:hypothetical protein
MADPLLGYNLALQGTKLLENSNTEEKKAQSYRYPLRRIESKSDYLEIRVIEYVPPGFTPGNVETKKENNATVINEETVSLATIPTGTEKNRNIKPLKYIHKTYQIQTQ